MRRVFQIICLFLLAVPVTAQTGGRNVALVIGISQYQDKKVPALQYSDKDASIFASYLRQRPNNKVTDERLMLLTNEKATISAIYSGLDWLKETCKKDDTAYIYFSGHGDLEVQTKFSIGYLLAYDSPPNNYRNNAIKLEDINDVANTLTVKNLSNVILITDACHSGKLAGDFQKGKQFVANQLRLVLNNEVRLTACGPDELAAESVNWGGGRGVFSFYLLQGLSGAADKGKDGIVQLSELNAYLDSSFASDRFLKREQHKQKPVIDGHPYFPMPSSALNTTAITTRADGLDSFSPLAIQPMDYFFAYCKNKPVESMIPFDTFKDGQPVDFPLQCVNELIMFTLKQTTTEEPYAYPSADSLKLLANQLKNPRMVSRFNERFIQLVHEKGQDMINAYLAGDLAELERRQYYYQGNRNYTEFRTMQEVALKMIPPEHYLSRLLTVQFNYIKGLTNRMKMAESNSTDSLAEDAMNSQRKALALEPYAAYIQNEIGNLLLDKEQFDSAAYHFDLATTLAPTWSIPWSNKVRLNLAKGTFSNAEQAFRKADSLQPDLAFNLMNAGLVMEKQQNWLAAETYYRRAIKFNEVHFFPYERLSQVYLRTGEFPLADYEIYRTKKRKQDFVLNNNSFRFGLPLGGRIVPDSSATKESISRRYQLARSYEDKNQLDSAIEQYKRIAIIENQLQEDQATYKGFQMPKGKDDEFIINGQNIFSSFEDPLPLTGIIKAVRLHEKLGNYQEAEKLLLEQIKKNRKAGDARQKALNDKKPGTWQLVEFGGIRYNFYWLDINAPLEGEAFNFYRRVIKKFPREGAWKEKAALFLHDRLAMSFNKIPVEDYAGFHLYIQEHAYPFTAGESPVRKGILYVLPGTNENLFIEMFEYDPVTVARNWMDEAVKLSGDITPGKKVLTVWANLNAWAGKTDNAIALKKLLIRTDPRNKLIRTNLIDLMVFNDDLTDALFQLDTLNNQKQATIAQQLKLADYLILSGKNDRAANILTPMRLTEIRDRDTRFFLIAKMYWLQNDFAKALPYMLDSMRSWKQAELAPDQANAEDQLEAATIPYLAARIYAVMNDEQMARKMLTRSRKNGFSFGNLLETDEAWKRFRQTDDWKHLNELYPYGVDYDESNNESKEMSLEYIIPNFKPIYHQ